MPLKKEIIERYVANKDYFFETGSWNGNGILTALNYGFKNVLSIEISEKFYNICKEKFKDNGNVKLILGDSCEILYDSIKDIDKPITFWLDGHFSGGDTGFGKYEYPLIQELEQISKHSIKTHTILIDDMRLLNDKIKNGFDKNDIINAIKKINKEYKIYYGDGYIKNDVLIAKI